MRRTVGQQGWIGCVARFLWLESGRVRYEALRLALNVRESNADESDKDRSGYGGPALRMESMSWLYGCSA